MGDSEQLCAKVLIRITNARHLTLPRKTVLRDFAELWPEKFYNVTNGVTPRRFVALANPGLTELITGKLARAGLQISIRCGISSLSQMMHNFKRSGAR